MSIRNVALLTVALGLATAVASAQSLVDVAKKEKERREKNKSEAKRVITDRELAGSYGGLPPARSAQAASQSSTAAAGDSADASKNQSKDDQPQDETKTQEYWQNRVKGAKDKIAKLETQLQSNDWGAGQRVGVDPRGQTNLGDRQKVEQELAAAHSELDAIQAEARRAGVPPGWVR